MAHSAVHSLRFPESFSRTSPLQDADLTPDAGFDTNQEDEAESHMFPTLDEVPWGQTGNPSLRRPSRSHVMRLENILNDVSIGHNFTPRSRSLCSSPTQCEALFDSDVSRQYLLQTALLTPSNQRSSTICRLLRQGASLLSTDSLRRRK